MSLLKNQHRPEADSLSAAGTDVDAELLHGLDQSGRVLGVESNVCSVDNADQYKLPKTDSFN